MTWNSTYLVKQFLGFLSFCFWHLYVYSRIRCGNAHTSILSKRHFYFLHFLAVWEVRSFNFLRRNFAQWLNKLPLLMYPNFRKIYETVFFRTENCKYLKNLCYNFSHFFYILFHFVLQIKHKIFKNFDWRKFKIFKKKCKNTTILKTSCYHDNRNFWQHVYFYVIPAIRAMLLVSFVVISYETSKQQASMHNCAVYRNKCWEPP